MSFDAIVIGGGIVGASLGYHMAKAGLQTQLIDRHDEGRATDAGAGILSPESSSKESEDWYGFGVKAVAYYRTLIDSLNSEQEGDTGYAMCGVLRVAVDSDELDAFDSTRKMVFDRQKRYQSSYKNDLYDVTPDQAKEIFPALADVQKALYHRTGARVDGRLLCSALIQAGIHHGLDVQNTSVDKVVIKDKKVVGVVVDGEEIRAGKVVIARWCVVVHI